MQIDQSIGIDPFFLLNTKVMLRFIKFEMSTRKSSLFSFISSIGKTRFLHSTGPSTSNRTHYEILGVKTTATTSEIRDAFFKLSKKYHPDVNKNDKQAHEQFVEINEAYSVLSKNDSRREYDAKLRQGQTYSSYNQDPSRERYRQYYDEVNRMRRQQQTPPPGFSKFGSKPPPEDPLRDFWNDYNQAFNRAQQQQQQQWQARENPRAGPRRPGIVMDEKANKAFYMFILTIFTISIIVHFLQFAMVRPREFRDYDDMDNWKMHRVVVDPPEAETKPKHGRGYPVPPTGSNSDGFVEA